MNTRRILTTLAMTAGAVFVWAATAAAAPPGNTTLPSITGTTKVGETLTAQNGTWTNSPTSFQYQWQRCDGAGASCVNIAGAVEKTYLLKAADATHTLRVRVLAVNADGSASARSGPTAVVTASTAPGNTARPSITGDARVGETLTAEDGTWTNSPTSFAYQWQRCDADGSGCAAISGSTAKTYGVRLLDLGFRLRVEVTAKNAGGGAGSALSGLTPIVDPTAAGHEQASDADDRLGSIRRRPRLRTLPDLRRRAEEPDDPRYGLASGQGVLHRGASRRGSRRTRAAPTRATGCRRPLQGQGPVHGHAPGTRHVRPDERTRSPVVLPLAAIGGGALARPARSSADERTSGPRVRGRVCEDRPVKPAERERVLERIREICLGLPETSERLSHGAPTFFVREKRSFLMVLTDHHGDGRFAIWCAAADGTQGMLVEADPGALLPAAVCRTRGWLGVRLDRGLDWNELAGIAEDAYAEVAPAKLVEAARAAGEET